FIFTPSRDRSLTDDPFGTRGRWPDEDVREVLIDGGDAWWGTAYGLRRRDSSGQETVFLPRRTISYLGQVDGTIFCHADDGDYRLSSGDWMRVNEAPAAAFPPLRVLTLQLGVDVGVVAVESISANGVSTVLPDFNAQQMRLTHDVIREIAGDSDCFWIVTLAGVQRLKTAQNVVNEHREYFKNSTVTALRRGADGRLYTSIGEGLAFRYEDDSAGWEALSSSNRSHPFATPLHGQLSPIVAWSRHFASNGDRYQLSTGGLTLGFVKGQLASDCITSVAGLASLRWEASSAGIFQHDYPNRHSRRERWIAWPSGVAGSEIAVDRGVLVLKSHGGSYGYDVQSRAWRKMQTSVFDLANAVFNGTRWETRSREADHESIYTGVEWNARSADVDRPHIMFQPAANRQEIVCSVEGASSQPVENQWRSKLNALGQFPFDAVHQVFSRNEELGLVFGAGLAFYQADVLRQPSFTPVRYLHAQRCSKWSQQQGTPSLAFDTRGRLWVALSNIQQVVMLVSDDNDHYSFRSPREGDGDNPFDRRPRWAEASNGTKVILQVSESEQLEATSNENQTSVVVIPKNRLVEGNQKILGIMRAGSNLWVVTSHGLEVVSRTILR